VRIKKLQTLNIVIFGNTNNYPLILAQGLRRLGHNVLLLVNRTDYLHRPESRYPEWAGDLPGWVIDCADITENDIIYDTPMLDRALLYLTNDVDLVVLNDMGLALASYLQTPYVAMLTGSDLAYYANYSMLDSRADKWDPEYKRSVPGRRNMSRFSDFVTRQRDGILGANVVCFGQRGLVPTSDRLLDRIGVTDSQRMMMFISNTIDLNALPHTKKRNLRILCGSRIVYRKYKNSNLGAIDFKGTDLLIKGFALYCDAGGKGKLYLIRKGQDVDAALLLIEKLGIGKHVKWLKEMSLSRFYEEMKIADVVCDQFGTSFPGMVTADAYAFGRPVIANFKNNIFTKFFPEPLPGLDAKTPEQIAEHLATIESNRKILEKIGYESRQYAEAYLAPEIMASKLLAKVFEDVK
jgi:glycosyltransferase involved in cell wall biosynthesis